MAQDNNGSNSSTSIPANRASLTEKMTKMRDGIRLHHSTIHAEEKGADTVVDEAIHDGKVIGRFVSKDGKLVESEGSADSQQSGTHDKIAKKLGFEGKTTHTAPEAVSIVAHDNMPKPIANDKAHDSAKVTKPTSNDKLNNNIEPDDAKLVGGKHKNEGGMEGTMEKAMPSIKYGAGENSLSYSRGGAPKAPHMNKADDPATPPKPATATPPAPAKPAAPAKPSMTPPAPAKPKENVLDYSKFKAPAPRNNWKEKSEAMREERAKGLPGSYKTSKGTWMVKSETLAKWNALYDSMKAFKDPLTKTVRSLDEHRERMKRIKERRGMTQEDKINEALNIQEHKRRRNAEAKKIPLPVDEKGKTKPHVLPPETLTSKLPEKAEKSTVAGAAKNPTQEAAKTPTIENAVETTIGTKPVTRCEGLAKHAPSSVAGWDEHLLNGMLEALIEEKVKRKNSKGLAKADVPPPSVEPEVEQKPKTRRYSLLTDEMGNTKTAKNASLGKHVSAILHLAPANMAQCGDVCPGASPGCRDACLNTAGRGGMIKAGENTNTIQDARIRKTRLLFKDPDTFFKDLAGDIQRIRKYAAAEGKQPALRLNGTSDIAWEDFRPAIWGGKNVFEAHPDVQFYDYTKRANRVRENKQPNYHLTFSRSEKNGHVAKQLLDEGHNVAVVFGGKQLPPQWSGHEVVSGDEHDLRFLDPKGGKVIGLKAKGDAKGDTSGFVVWKHEGDPTAVPLRPERTPKNQLVAEHAKQTFSQPSTELPMAAKPAKKSEEPLEKEYVGFDKLKNKLAHKGGVSNPGAVAAAIGREKYGKEKFQHAAAEGKKLGKAEYLSKPPVSEAQRRAMYAAASGHSTLGIPKKVGKEFTEADKGGKLPEKMDKGDVVDFKTGKTIAKDPESAGRPLAPSTTGVGTITETQKFNAPADTRTKEEKIQDALSQQADKGSPYASKRPNAGVISGKTETPKQPEVQSRESRVKQSLARIEQLSAELKNKKAEMTPAPAKPAHKPLGAMGMMKLGREMDKVAKRKGKMKKSEDQLPGGKANANSFKEMSPYEKFATLHGALIEFEHGPTAPTEIATDHVVENGPEYYDEKKGLQGMEAKLNKAKPATASEFEQGMPPAYGTIPNLDPQEALSMCHRHHKMAMKYAAEGNKESAKYHHEHASLYWNHHRKLDKSEPMKKGSNWDAMAAGMKNAFGGGETPPPPPPPAPDAASGGPKLDQSKVAAFQAGFGKSDVKKCDTCKMSAMLKKAKKITEETPDHKTKTFMKG